MNVTVTRHNVREMALQALFIASSHPDLAITAALQQVLHYWQVEQCPEYLTFLVTDVWDERTQLDQQLSQYLKTGWQIQRLSRIDLNILRLGLFEIKNSPAIPAKVAINEALELVNQYSTADAKKFINGVLSNFIPDSAE